MSTRQVGYRELVDMAVKEQRRFFARGYERNRDLYAHSQDGAESLGLSWEDGLSPGQVCDTYNLWFSNNTGTYVSVANIPGALDEALAMGEHPRQHWSEGTGQLLASVSKEMARDIMEDVIKKNIGAVKFDSDKPRMGLISPAFANEIAAVLTFGEKKYATPDGSSNWRAAPGLGIDRVLDAAERHISALRQGEDFDPETGCSHAAHAACCLQFAHHYINHPEVFKDDRRWNSWNTQEKKDD